MNKLITLLCAMFALLPACSGPVAKRPAPRTAVKARPAVKAASMVLGKGDKAFRDASPLVKVSAGFFARGSMPGKGEPDECPRRNIYLDEFYIDRFAVSVAQYRRCVEGNKCSPPDTSKGCNWPRPPRKASAEEDEFKDDEEEPERELPPDLDRHPVTCVSWFQADEYCRWVGKRLPSEAEWEKAARGVRGNRYPWGNAEPTCKQANFFLNKKKYCRGRGLTAPVSAYAKVFSPYGAVQLSGNVYQWTKDWYGKEFYGKSEERNPLGPFAGKYRVVRGGSWFSPSNDLRATSRGPLPPGMQLPYLGFRCAAFSNHVVPWTDGDAVPVRALPKLVENPGVPHRLTGLPLLSE